MYDGFQLANDKVGGEEKKEEGEVSEEEEVAEIDKELEKKLLKQVSLELGFFIQHSPMHEKGKVLGFFSVKFCHLRS